ncbi:MULTISPECIES: asparagine synthase-related protein [Actinosynnema]|uniref:asparagine synthase-related protein n=1 Tax=Actinosynnema TaxID=40566 RepID=UPI0020A4B8EA|nr:asparagine synthase-related protein [Actinosynnema pretiosum]MCP2094439.1 asparagine synthase (glutamine-hydrolyzing) [Actinosynnema pretiosum]
MRVHARRLVTHPGGRPWLVGDWPDGALAVGRARDTTVALLGQHAVTAEGLTAVAERLTAPGAAPGFPGSAHLLVSSGGAQHLRGSVVRARRLFRATAHGVALVSDHADVLAHLLDAPVDEDALSLRLLSPNAPHPLDSLSTWRGVRAVPAATAVDVDRRGVARERRWWWAPEPVLPAAEGVPLLRAAIAEAVRVRLPRLGEVTADLGGIDSTGLCCTAARATGRVLACTFANPDPADDDVEWARRTSADLDAIRLHVIPVERQAVRYVGLGAVTEVFDEPALFAPDLARIAVPFDWAAEHGSAVHLSGYGGDEVFSGAPAWVLSRLRADPRGAVRDLRGYRARGRWRFGATARQALLPRPYRSWLRGAATGLRGPVDDRAPVLDWFLRPTATPWTTPEAEAAARRLLLAAARDAEPLSPVRGQHVDLQLMHGGSAELRKITQLAAARGVTLATPYYDDAVVTAALSIAPADRVSPWRYKRLAEPVFRDVVPAASAARQTKGDGATSHAVGLARHRAEVVELLEDSHAHRLGLVDARAAAAALRSSVDTSDALAGDLYPLLGCEVWLRTVGWGGSATGGAAG